MTLIHKAVCALALASLPALAIEAGEPAPPLSGQRLDASRFGIAPEALRGQVVYVDFWASWCVPCRQSMPALDALYRKHGSAGFTVVGVSKDVTEADARRFLQRVAVGFPLVLDEGDKLARAFNVKAMPSGYLVDRNGIVRHVHRGFTDETPARLDAEIVSLLGEKK